MRLTVAVAGPTGDPQPGQPRKRPIIGHIRTVPKLGRSHHLVTLSGHALRRVTPHGHAASYRGMARSQEISRVIHGSQQLQPGNWVIREMAVPGR